MNTFPINLLPTNEIEAELKRRRAREILEEKTQIEAHKIAIANLEEKLAVLLSL